MADLHPAPPQRPVLTLPGPEAEALTEAYLSSRVILEYGSGGSTVLAGERGDGLIFSVESDAAWLAAMQAWFAANPPRSPVHLHHADIGPTKAWGFPKGRRRMDQWPAYAFSVWERPDFQAPDLVLVDGRFRLACMLTTLYSIDRPTVMLVDDYIHRTPYHRIETLAGAPVMIGRMAVFTLTPAPDLPQDLDWIAAAYTDPH